MLEVWTPFHCRPLFVLRFCYVLSLKAYLIKYKIVTPNVINQLSKVFFIQSMVMAHSSSPIFYSIFILFLSQADFEWGVGLHKGWMLGREWVGGQRCGTNMIFLIGIPRRRHSRNIFFVIFLSNHGAHGMNQFTIPFDGPLISFNFSMYFSIGSTLPFQTFFGYDDLW